MNPVSKIVHRSLTGLFYRQNAGLFFFLFFLLFGTQPSFFDVFQLHYSFIKSILTSNSFLLITIGIWLIYAVKILSFIYGCFKKETYAFIFLLNEIPVWQRCRYIVQVIIALLGPVLVYALIIVGTGIKKAQWTGIAKVLLAIFILILIVTYGAFLLLQRARENQRVHNGILSLQAPVPAGLFSFALAFIFQRQFLALAITKLLTFSSLFFFSRTEVSLFEDRMLWFILISSLTGHSFIIYRLFNFLEREMGFYRNMPLKNWSVLLSLYFVYLILLLPEAWALLGVAVNQHNWSDYLWMIATGPSFLLLLHSLLYTEDMNMEEFLKLLFGVWVVFIFFSLSKNHWILPLISSVFAVIIFYMSFRSYEKDTGVEGVE
jgi:hypothetical protein